jgi:hypothetical protein
MQKKQISKQQRAKQAKTASQRLLIRQTLNSE